MPDIPSKFQKDPSITFRVISLTHRQTDKQTNKNRQKHYLLGGGNNVLCSHCSKQSRQREYAFSSVVSSAVYIL